MMAPNYDYGVQTNYMLFLFFIFFIMFMLSIKSKNCSCSFWYFKYIWRKTEFWHARETSFLTYFSQVFLFCTPLWTSENLRSSIISRRYKIETLKRNRWNYDLCMLIFRQLKNSFYQGATFINCFRIFNGDSHDRSVLAFK